MLIEQALPRPQAIEINPPQPLPRPFEAIPPSFAVVITRPERVQGLSSSGEAIYPIDPTNILQPPIFSVAQDIRLVLTPGKNQVRISPSLSAVRGRERLDLLHFKVNSSEARLRRRGRRRRRECTCTEKPPGRHQCNGGLSGRIN